MLESPILFYSLNKVIPLVPQVSGDRKILV